MTDGREDRETGTTSASELEALDPQECHRLLATQELGRLGVVVDHYPLVLPVNYALDGDVVVVRLHPGPLLSAASHANVSFEVDQVDPATRSGWSVLVRGLAEEVTGDHAAELAERTRASGASPWAPGERDHWVRVIPHAVSGRRIVPGRLPTSSPGYL